MDGMKKCLKPYIGIGICALASLFFCVCNVFVKHLKHVDPLLIGCLRLFFMAMLSSPVTVLRFYEVELSIKALLIYFPFKSFKLLHINKLLLHSCHYQGCWGCFSTPRIWEFCSPFSIQRGQIMPTTLLLAPPDLKT